MDKSIFNEDFLISSADYRDVLEQTVLPALSGCSEDLSVSGKGGFPLFCSVFRAENPRGTVLVLHGFTENAFKYSELIYSLLMNRFNVVAYDQRGHGRSGRAEGLSHPSVTHVDRFMDYVEDLDIVCRTVLQDLPRPWTVFAHSMGGAVTALFLERHPEVFSAAALCAPMIAPYTGGIPAAAAGAMARIFCLFGQSRKNPFFMKPYSGKEDFASSCATDFTRFSWYAEEKDSCEAWQNSVPSCRWIAESAAVTRKILAPGAPESIRCPVLLSTADHDFSVRADAQEKFISRVPGGKHIFVKDSRHEIFRSVNAVFFPWWHDILSFLMEAHV